MFDLGLPELLLILVVALVLFGAKRLPEVARGLGQSLNAFKSGLKEGLQNSTEAKAEVKGPPDAPKA